MLGVCVLILLMAHCVTALAELDPLKVAMSLSTNTFTEPKRITVQIQVTNNGDSEMPSAVTLYYPNGRLVEAFGAPVLAQGETKTWSGTWDVTQEELDEGKLTFKLRYSIYNDDGELVAKEKRFHKTLIYKGSVVSCEIKRSITPTTARKDQEVSVTYEVVNTGNLPLTDVEITENKAISSTVGKIAEIPAGEKGTYTFTVKMGTKDLVSKATITYKADGKKYSDTKEAATIKYGEVKLNASLSADKKGGLTGETVKLTLKLSNTGSVDYENITVSDSRLGQVFTGQSVKAGESVTLEKEISIAGSGDYQFTVQGQDTAGNEVETASDRVSITAIEPNQVVNLTVEAEADRLVVYQIPATVRFRVRVTNNAAADVENVKVTATGVTLYTFDKIAAGETRDFVRDCSISMQGKFQFVASVRNQLGETQNFNSNIISVAYTAPTPVPTDAPIVTPPKPNHQQLPTEADMADIFGVVEYSKGVEYLRYAAYGFGALAAIGLLLLIGAGITRAVGASRTRKAEDVLEIAPARDYTVPARKPINMPLLDDGLTAARPAEDAPEEGGRSRRRRRSAETPAEDSEETREEE